MASISTGALVKFAADGREQDGIVFDMPSALKVVVAMVDPHRGPLFRTVHPDTLTARSADGPDDAALRRLIRRTPPPSHGARNSAASRRGLAGHTRAPSHRTTGR